MATPLGLMARDHSDEFNSGVYVIRNKQSGEMYVGSSSNIKTRWKQRYCGRLNKDMNEHGRDAFEYALVIPCDPDRILLSEIETWLIAQVCPGYNQYMRAGASILGVKRSEETKKKMGAWQIGRVLPNETREKISKARTGVPGHKQSAEAREKVAASKRGVPRDPDVIARVVATKRAKKEAARLAMLEGVNNG